MTVWWLLGLFYGVGTTGLQWCGGDHVEGWARCVMVPDIGKVFDCDISTRSTIEGASDDDEEETVLLFGLGSMRAIHSLSILTDWQRKRPKHGIIEYEFGDVERYVLATVFDSPEGSGSDCGDGAQTFGTEQCKGSGHLIGYINITLPEPVTAQWWRIRFTSSHDSDGVMLVHEVFFVGGGSEGTDSTPTGSTGESTASTGSASTGEVTTSTTSSTTSSTVSSASRSTSPSGDGAGRQAPGDHDKGDDDHLATGLIYVFVGLSVMFSVGSSVCIYIVVKRSQAQVPASKEQQTEQHEEQHEEQQSGAADAPSPSVPMDTVGTTEHETPSSVEESDSSGANDPAEGTANPAMVKIVVQENDADNARAAVFSTQKNTQGTNLSIPFGSLPFSDGALSIFMDANSDMDESTSMRMSETLYGAQMSWKRGRILGQGACGKVYLGINEETDTVMAVKEIKLTSLPETMQREILGIENEIGLLATLQHTNIVRYLGASHSGKERDAVFYIFLEYVGGGSLHGFVQDMKGVPEVTCQGFTEQILEGLSYLHSAGILHRDIKSSNILLSDMPNRHHDRTLKIADFGASKDIKDKTVGGGRTVVGTPYFMAPEVITRSGYGPSSDVWSLACTVIEMITTQPPWVEYDPMVALFRIGSSEEVPAVPLGMSPAGTHFLLLCFDRDPKKRPGTRELAGHDWIESARKKKTEMSPSRSGLAGGDPILAASSALEEHQARCDGDEARGRGAGDDGGARGFEHGHDEDVNRDSSGGEDDDGQASGTPGDTDESVPTNTPSTEPAWVVDSSGEEEVLGGGAGVTDSRECPAEDAESAPMAIRRAAEIVQADAAESVSVPNVDVVVSPAGAPTDTGTSLSSEERLGC